MGLPDGTAQLLDAAFASGLEILEVLYPICKVWQPGYKICWAVFQMSFMILSFLLLAKLQIDIVPTIAVMSHATFAAVTIYGHTPCGPWSSYPKWSLYLGVIAVVASIGFFWVPYQTAAQCMICVALIISCAGARAHETRGPVQSPVVHNGPWNPGSSGSRQPGNELLVSPPAPPTWQRVAVIGPQRAGKTRVIVSHGLQNTYTGYAKTFEDTYNIRRMVHGKVINLEVHDTGGCDLVEHAEWIQKWWAANSYRILVYDVTSRQSFDRLKELVEKHHPSSAAFIYAALPLGGRSNTEERGLFVCE
ncbi:Ras family GTPase RAS2 [Apiospora kogelbergensis]|uniref:Ras family GTPase RAS2 n=1 Tax=Apiospora kogelbergensis TaxID=1337665 RepID=UPI00312F3C67